MKNFTAADVTPHGTIPTAGRICVGSDSELIRCPLEWHTRGLCQTSTGYGAKLTTQDKIQFEGKAYRLYNTCYGNASFSWFAVKGRKIFVR